MIDLADFHRLPDENAWVRRSNPEVIIAGTADAPLPGRVEVADAVLNDIDQLLAVSSAYLEHFVDRKRFAPASDWHLEYIEFGRRGHEPPNELTAFFSLEEDIYGLWSVTLSYDHRHQHLTGIGFARQQR